MPWISRHGRPQQANLWPSMNPREEAVAGNESMVKNEVHVVGQQLQNKHVKQAMNPVVYECLKIDEMGKRVKPNLIRTAHPYVLRKSTTCYIELDDKIGLANFYVMTIHII